MKKLIALLFFAQLAHAQVDTVARTDSVNAGRRKWNMNDLYLRSTALNAGDSASLALSRVENMKFVSILDYGAVGDGVTDSREAIQAAIDSAIANGIHRVFIPSGTFISSVPASGDGCILLRSGIEIFGSGGSSVIKRASFQRGANYLFLNDVANQTAAGDSDIVIRDLILDGNGANNGMDSTTWAQYGIGIWKSKRVRVQNVTGRDFRGTAPDGVSESVIFNSV